MKRYRESEGEALFTKLKQRKVRQSFALYGEVSALMEKVANEGDEALIALTAKFDDIESDELSVSTERMRLAYENAEKAYVDALKIAIRNIRDFHTPQIQSGYELKSGGVRMGQRVLPIERVGLYVPGGEAAYPSTLLMNAIPAQLAGTKEIVVVTPPQKDQRKLDAVLTAAYMLGITEMYLVGGVQAIAALTYGTETIRPVDKICGPGNKYVATAKKIAFGDVAIDMIAGPSEIMVVSDGSQPISFIAADLIAQLEHDREAMAVLLTTSEDEWQSIETEVRKQLSLLKNPLLATEAFEANAYIVLCSSVFEMLRIANRVAPEHLELMIDDPDQYLDVISSAGAVFLGAYTPETLGDYLAGPNHTLPTTGSARYASPLGTYDFQKRINYLKYDKATLSGVRDALMAFTDKEGLDGHGRAVTVRI